MATASVHLVVHPHSGDDLSSSGQVSIVLIEDETVRHDRRVFLNEGCAAARVDGEAFLAVVFQPRRKAGSLLSEDHDGGWRVALEQPRDVVRPPLRRWTLRRRLAPLHFGRSHERRQVLRLAAERRHLPCIEHDVDGQGFDGHLLVGHHRRPRPGGS